MTGKRQLEHFLRYLRYEKRYSPHTLVAYEGDLRQFKTFIRNQYEMKCLTDVDHSQVRSWVYELADSGMDRKSINRKISSLRSFYKFLKKEQLVKVNPVTAIQPLKTARRLPEVVPEEKIKNYLTFTDCHLWSEYRDRILIMLLYETGMRRSEFQELRWTDVDLTEGYIKVLGKRQKQRQIPIRSGLAEILKNFRDLTLSEFEFSSKYVMLTDKGGKVYPKWIYNKVKSILGTWVDSGCLSPHVLRHSIATHLLNAGADIQIIREFLGHSSLAATEIYTHNSIGKLKQTYKSAFPDLDLKDVIQ